MEPAYQGNLLRQWLDICIWKDGDCRGIGQLSAVLNDFEQFGTLLLLSAMRAARQRAASRAGAGLDIEDLEDVKTKDKNT